VFFSFCFVISGVRICSPFPPLQPERFFLASTMIIPFFDVVFMKASSPSLDELLFPFLFRTSKVTAIFFPPFQRLQSGAVFGFLLLLMRDGIFLLPLGCALNTLKKFPAPFSPLLQGWLTPLRGRRWKLFWLEAPAVGDRGSDAASFSKMVSTFLLQNLRFDLVPSQWAFAPRPARRSPPSTSSVFSE